MHKLDTATQINQLLLQLDLAALALTDGQHPQVDIRLDLDCTQPGAADISTCALTAAQSTATGLELTLRPVTAHCRACGALFALLPGDQTLACPACAAPTQADPPGTAAH
jgi:hypothetical protein